MKLRPATRFVTVGHVSFDTHVIVSTMPSMGQDVVADIHSRRHGGAAGNVAAAIALGGCPAGVVSRVGNDEAGHDLLGGLRDLGVDVDSIVKDDNAATSEFVVVMDSSGERSFFLDPDRASFSVQSSQVVQSLRPTDVVVFAGCELALALEVARAVDNQLFAAVGFWVSSGEIDDAGFGDLLDRLSGVFLNAEEAARLAASGRSSQELATGDREVVVTGGSGVTTVRSSGVEYRTSPASVVRLHDTIGAGDAFMGSYLAGLMMGLDVAQRCEVAHQAGAIIAGMPDERSPKLRQLWK